jgi:hypothetical protein
MTNRQIIRRWGRLLGEVFAPAYASGAFAAQVNPIVLRYTVDTIERFLREGRTASEDVLLCG